MSWFGKGISIGGLQDIAGAVNKLTESVKNIEKNFDSALGLDAAHGGDGDADADADADASESQAHATERKGFSDSAIAFIGQKHEQGDSEVNHQEPLSENEQSHGASITKGSTENESVSPSKNDAVNELVFSEEREETKDSNSGNAGTFSSAKSDVSTVPIIEDGNMERKEVDVEIGDKSQTQLQDSKLLVSDDSATMDIGTTDMPDDHQREIPMQDIKDLEVGPGPGAAERNHLQEREEAPEEKDLENVVDGNQVSLDGEAHVVAVVQINDYSDKRDEQNSHMHSDPLTNSETAPQDNIEAGSESGESPIGDSVPPMSEITKPPDSAHHASEINTLRHEMKMMEAALQGAARQAQSKADEIAKLMYENEQLKSAMEDLKSKSTELEIETLKEEYHQRVSSLERKVYSLTKERDMLRKEQNKKSDAAALLKEKDEIINQVMAEGEELSKKQAAQEATIRKLRAQIRELEEEKQKLTSKLQVEETKVESIKRDKLTTEKLLQETIERNQAELAAQKEFYTNALNAAKDAEALAEARANNEAKVELESRLREADEKEAILVKTLEELRHTLTRKEQEASFKEEMLKRDIDDLQKRFQASELRYNELVTQVPESTRPLLRQIEAMQETAARRAEAWAGVERALNSRLQEAEAKAAAAEERERSVNERLSQSLSRITVLETQITILRTEQSQLSRSLEKERQRASENRQEFLVLQEEAAVQEGRAKQLEDENRELRAKHKKERQEAEERKNLLEKELENEKNARAELEKVSSRDMPKTVNQDATRGSLPVRKLSSAGSINSIEESQFLQASLDLSDGVALERRMSGESNVSSYFLKTMTPSAFEAALRQKDGEIASYMSRLASLEAIRDSLAEELVKLTEQCEKLRTEAVMVPGIRAELEALRQRHSQALELMGERDEELEELKNDIVDLKEMYREQVDLLVNQLQTLSSRA